MSGDGQIVYRDAYERWEATMAYREQPITCELCDRVVELASADASATGYRCAACIEEQLAVGVRKSLYAVTERARSSPAVLAGVLLVVLGCADCFCVVVRGGIAWGVNASYVGMIPLGLWTFCMGLLAAGCIGASGRVLGLALGTVSAAISLAIIWVISFPAGLRDPFIGWGNRVLNCAFPTWALIASVRAFIALTSASRDRL
jgi:hypothetical protein